MKKLMIALAAVAMAAGVQASSIQWAVAVNEDLTDSTCYMFSSSQRSAVEALLSNFTSAADLTALALKKNDGTSISFDNATVSTTRSGTSTSYASTAMNLTSADSVFAVIFEDTIAVGTDYQMTANTSVSGYTYEPPASATQIKFTGASFTEFGTIQSVPEPTSGLLLLLGMAGLALRRRRA